jgi:hypothetical protein
MQKVNYLSVKKGNHIIVTLHMGLDADLYDRYEVRVASDSKAMVTMSYEGENLYTAADVKKMLPDTSTELKIYGLSEGIAEIEIWAINNWGEDVCIAGDAIKHGGTARFDKLVVEVTT